MKEDEVCVHQTSTKKSHEIKEVDENEIFNPNKTTAPPSENSKIRTRNKKTDLFVLTCLFGAVLGITLEIVFSKLNVLQSNEPSKYPPKYWVFSETADVENEKGLLRTVHSVLNRVGFEKSSSSSYWTLLWAHDFPFTVLRPIISDLKPFQRVNHFPGTGYISNKVNLATETGSTYIPKAFKLPEDKEAFYDYAGRNKDALFLEKHNNHRGVFMKNVSSVDITSGKSFVQEYIQRPFLVDGYKFDIGVYVVLTSVNPLRAYWYKGDVLFRYCPEKYYPFDPKNLDKYVIADDYRPTWKVPSLTHTYTSLGYGMKDSFDGYVKSQGKDPARMWSEVQKAIAEVFVKNERFVVRSLMQRQASGKNFFELFRFDLMVDEDLNVFLLEANMSPNLSSAHYPPNQLLYEQMLYSLFSVTGVSSYLRRERIAISDVEAADRMITSRKNAATWGVDCNATCGSQCGETARPVCDVCWPCMSSDMRASLLQAHYEHMHRADFRRLFPPPMTPVASPEEVKLSDLTKANQLQKLWYQGKCNADITWCT